MENIKTLARQHIERESGDPATITLAEDGAAELRDLLERFQAFASSARGDAVRRYFRAVDLGDGSDEVLEELRAIALPFDAPLNLLADAIYRMAPHIIEAGNGLTDHGRSLYESALGGA